MLNEIDYKKIMPFAVGQFFNVFRSGSYEDKTVSFFCLCMWSFQHPLYFHYLWTRLGPLLYIFSFNKLQFNTFNLFLELISLDRFSQLLIYFESVLLS